MSRLVQFAIALIIVFTALPSAARLTRGVSLDGDVTGADKSFVGTVTGERTLVNSRPGPFRSTVRVVELSLSVDLPLRNTKTSETVRLRHLILLPATEPAINGFSPANVRKGSTYLFLLRALRTGRFELIAIEHAPVELTPGAVPTLLKEAAKHKQPLDKATAVLMKEVSTCKQKCHGAIWMLANSKQIKGTSKQARARSRRFGKALEAIVSTSQHDNTLNSAYTELGRRGAIRLIPRIVRIATQDPKATKRNLSNTLSWLQGFAKDDQVRALNDIMAKAKDPNVVAFAKMRLKNLKR